jgi:hypothetical protein
MSISRRFKRGWAIGLPLVAVGLVTTAPRSLRTEPETPGTDQFGRALAVGNATIGELLRRIDDLEESVLRADLLRRAGTLGPAVASTVTDPAGTPGGASGTPASGGPPPALLEALAAPTEGDKAPPAASAEDEGRGATSSAPPAVDDRRGAAPIMPAAMVVAASERDGVAWPVTGRVSLAGWESGFEPMTPLPPETAASGADAGPAGAAVETAPAAEAGPGGEGIDETLRALERTLVQAGGLLLPKWALEVEPRLEYTLDESGGLRFANGIGLVNHDVRRDSLTSSLTFRLGLPWEAQAEVTVPYVLNQERTAMGNFAQETHNGTGLGDVEIGLTRQLLWESDLVPDLLAAVRWKTTTGESAFDVDLGDLAVGSGFHAVSGTLTAVKSREPLVFFGNLTYTGNLPNTKTGLDIDPGDTVGFTLGSILAAGPGTSLSFALDTTFSQATEVNSRDIPGSDGASATLKLGASTVLPFSASRSLLSVTAGVGVTDDAPDLRLVASLPYRF